MNPTVRRILTPTLALVLVVCAATTACSQTDTAQGKHWYDTLTVTQPRLALPTRGEMMVLRAASAVVIPITVTVATTTLIPPGFALHVSEGKVTPLFFFGTGVGFGGDTALPTFFPAFRVQAEGAISFVGTRQMELRLSAHRDFRFFELDRRGLNWLGAEAGLGFGTTFGRTLPFVEGWLGVMNPMGIRFIGYFPMHNIGLRGRVGYDDVSRKQWYEIGIGATSTFWF